MKKKVLTPLQKQQWKVMMASVPSSMELMNDPCVKVRVGIFFRPRPA